MSNCIKVIFLEAKCFQENLVRDWGKGTGKERKSNKLTPWGVLGGQCTPHHTTELSQAGQSSWTFYIPLPVSHWFRALPASLVLAGKEVSSSLGQAYDKKPSGAGCR